MVIAINIDADLENADWTKRTWDLPYNNEEELKEGLGKERYEQFKKLHAYRSRPWASEEDVNLDPKQPKQRKNSHPPVVDVPRPCCEEVQKYLRRWDGLENYSLQESALDKLFFQTYPNNTDINDVLIKVSSLNDFYSTKIFIPFNVAKHIISLNIDDRLAAGDVTLVNEIAKVKKDNGEVKTLYSFATKYCSHHKPLEFPIYDSFVDRLLRYFRDKDCFLRFSNDDLKDYVKFKNILIQFSGYYKLEPYNIKEIDKYLWQLGKDIFPRTY